MFQILNRITWILSLATGCIISYLIVGMYNQGAVVILGLLFAFGIKYILFSPNYIRERLSYFQEKLLEPLQSQKKTTLSEASEQVLSQKVEEKKEQIHQEFEAIDTTITQSETLEVQDTLPKVQDTLPREPGMIAKFFSENLLAKLGGIIVFLGVLFFISLTYIGLGPVEKILIGFIIGFLFFIAGVFADKVGFKNEARIIMGVGFLINYLVILGGRYLLEGGHGYLTVGATFIFLILNTLFAVMTSLVYNSRTLLVFAFAFAYLNPLLLGESSTEPYTLLGYTMIVTLGALFLSYKKKDEILFPLAFICASVLLLGAPWSDSNGWIAKLLCINTIGALSLYVSTAFEKKYQYVHELLIGGTFFLIGIMGFLGMSSLSLLQLTFLGFSILILMLFCYITSKKGGYLYSIGTLGSVLTLTPALLSVANKEEFLSLSTTLILVFFLLNVGFIIQSKKDFLIGNIVNVVGGLLSGAFFITYIIYTFGNIYFPGILQGFLYLLLACSYAGLAFFSLQKIGVEEMKKSQEAKNVFYALSAIAISFFTLAVAFVFSEQKEIVSLVWLLESAVLFFLASRVLSGKVALGGIILYIIGSLGFTSFIYDVYGVNSYGGDFGFLAALIFSIGVILIIAYLFSPWVQKKQNKYLNLWIYGTHDFFHTVNMIIIGFLIFDILQLPTVWLSMMYVAFYMSTLGIIYVCLRLLSLQKVWNIFYSLALLTHIFLFIDNMMTDAIDLMLSFFIFSIFSLPVIFTYLENKRFKADIPFIIFSIYFFILSTLYVYQIFDQISTITFYWGVLAFILFSSGIIKDLISIRTLGLYLITLTVGKIFLYDIWVNANDLMSRVQALIAVGILMIILSIMYTKKYGNVISKEFNIGNIFSKQDEDEKEPEIIKQIDIVSQIENTDVGDIVGVRMYIQGEEKPIQIRAKNLIKIAKIIQTNFGKSEFQAGELKAVFQNFSLNYQSTLPKNQYEKIYEIVEQFVLKGGKMEFVKNS